MKCPARLLLWLIAAIAAFNVCAGTGLIADWGRWYSPDLAYRQQTEAMQRGRIALSSSPSEVQHDMAWAEGSVQQVWGLGVPSWRLPFEIIAAALAQEAFPDRLALAIAITVATVVVLHAFCPMEVGTPVGRWTASLAEHPERVAAAALLIFFPPVLTICSGPFNVYEEAVTYEYYASIALLAGTIVVVNRPRLWSYGSLSLLAGLSGCVRPTMVFYGLATSAICWQQVCGGPWSRLQKALGPALFALGGGLLFWSNLLRFGSGFEFGHKLNLSSMDLMYASRFPAPYHDEPIWATAKELLGSVFFVKCLNGFDVYGRDIVAWQTPAPRWRHFYGTTFDASYLAALLWLWILTLWKTIQWSRTRAVNFSLPTILGAWSFIGMAPLAVFYLRFHSISSRYVLDFAPGIATALAGGLLVAARAASTVKRPGMSVPAMLLAVAGWWTYQVYFAEQRFPRTETLTQTETLARLRQLSTTARTSQLPYHYELGVSPAAASGIRQNGVGWSPDGVTEPIVVLFVVDLQELRLEVAPVDGRPLNRGDLEVIAAKVGLEKLALAATEKTDRGWLLTFAAPRRAAYRTGTQVVFLRFAPPTAFLDGPTPFKMLNVEWGPSGESGQ